MTLEYLYSSTSDIFYNHYLIDNINNDIYKVMIFISSEQIYCIKKYIISDNMLNLVKIFDRTNHHFGYLTKIFHSIIPKIWNYISNNTNCIEYIILHKATKI